MKLHGYRRRDILRLLGTGCVITLCVVILHVMRPELLTHFERKVYDVLLSQTSQRPLSPVPVLIAIDDKSLTDLGQWPWPRHVLASLITRLHEAGADIVALDLILSARDRTSPLLVQEELRQETGFSIDLEGLPGNRLDHDRLLAEALAKMPTVLGYKLLFTPNHGKAPFCDVHPILSGQSMPAGFSPYTAETAVCPLTILNAAATNSGFINALPDSDGVIRRTPLIALHADEVLPSLILATVMTRGETAIGLGQDADGNFVQFGRKRTHIDAQGNVLLRYRGPSGTFTTYSATDILSGPLPNFQGRVAIVGPTASGLGDNHVTPVGRVFPGIEIHATLLDNLLQKDTLIRPSWAIGAEACAIVLAGLLSSLLMMSAGPLTCAAGLVVGATGVWSASLWLLNGPGYWISPLSTEIILMGNMALLSLIKYGMEERELRIRGKQLLQAQDATIMSLTALAETRDPETGGHIRRTREYVLVLARVLARKPKFKKYLDRDTIELLYKSAPLHDIGKVGIADNILLKPGSLTPEEFKEMQRHTILGAETLAEAERRSMEGSDRSFLGLAREIALSHHEKWDGSGYPQGLKEEAIPIGGRLMALADVYDALVTKRVYKNAMPHADACQIILAGRGSHFDPDVVDAFEETQHEFLAISNRYD
ncbi:adenylate cyclase [Desulfomicrobium apsheronum]|uniref:Adenylate cyclase n=1 Tax=Desulfomicrobium apsheronum TaxID=52560 RepID=A0A1I3QIA8_9BACT|nr:CHASE2 domain-containing protein [Desulfomicrobium apsheronum]SFJ33500.1 adenylate cyclase [Desulfomicrobium apsheronum]